MDDLHFDAWLAALEAADGCKENAVREYVTYLRTKKAHARDIVDDAVFLLEHDSKAVVSRASIQHPNQPVRTVKVREWLAQADRFLNVD